MQEIIVKIGLVIALLFSVFVGGCQYGKSGEQLKAKDVVIQAAAVTEKVKDSGQIAANTAETKQIEKIVYVQQAAKVITKERIVYVEKNPAAAVHLDPEWMRLHNLASKGCDPSGSPCVPDEDSTQGTTAGQAIAVITTNYAQYQDCRAEVEGWQDFYADLKKKFDNAAVSK